MFGGLLSASSIDLTNEIKVIVFNGLQRFISTGHEVCKGVENHYVADDLHHRRCAPFLVHFRFNRPGTAFFTFVSADG